MKIKTTIAALALALTPGLAAAAGCNWDHSKETTASQCMTGQTWDSTSQTCVDASTS